jgi:hypothetical protein
VSEISQIVWREYGNDSMPAFEFVAADVERLPERTKHMNAVEQSAATELFLQSLLSSGAQSKRLFDLAAAKYQLAARLQPNDRTTLVAWANALFIRARKLSHTADVLASEAMFGQALDLFRAAAAHEMLFSWGNYEHAKALEERNESQRRALKYFSHAEQLFEAGIDALAAKADGSDGVAADASALTPLQAAAAAEINDARHRGLFCWASASYDRAIVLHQRPTMAGALYRRAIRVAPARYHDDARRAAAELADEELAVLMQLLMQQEQVLTFAAWRDVRLRAPLVALHWSRCFGVAPRQIASILECTRQVHALYLGGCTELSDIDACRAIMALSDSLRTLDLSMCTLVSAPTMTHVISLCGALRSIDVTGCIMLRQDSIKRLLQRFHKQPAALLGLECASCGADDDKGGGDAGSFVHDVIGAMTPQLETLKLHRLSLLSRAGVAALLAGVAQRAVGLHSLHLSWCLALDDSVLESLARQFAHLRDLALVQCPRITERGVCEFVRRCHTLERIDVSYSCARRFAPPPAASTSASLSLSASSASASLSNSSPAQQLLLLNSDSSATDALLRGAAAAAAAAASSSAKSGSTSSASVPLPAASSSSLTGTATVTSGSTGVSDDSLAMRIAAAALPRELHVDTAVLNVSKFVKRVAALPGGARIDGNVLNIVSCQLTLAMAYELLDAFHTITDQKSAAPLVSAIRVSDVTYAGDEMLLNSSSHHALPYALGVLLAAIGPLTAPLDSLVLNAVSGSAATAPLKSSSQRSVGDSVCDRIAALIEQDRVDIRQIVLQRNGVTALGLATLVRSFRGSLLDVSQNEIDRLDADADTAVCAFVATNRALRLIDVSDNAAGADLLVAVATGLLAGVHADKEPNRDEADADADDDADDDDDDDDDARAGELDDEVVRIRVAPPPPASKEAAPSHAGRRKRHRLLLRACNCGAIGGRAAERLARALEQRAPVYALALAGCSIDGETMETLAAALASSVVRKLDVSRNDFGDRGALALAEAMDTCRLIDLDLRHTKLTDAGIAAICAAACGAQDVVARLARRRANGASDVGETDEQLLERTRNVRNGSVAAPLRRLRLEDNRCWTVGARWIARVIECVASDLKLSVTFGVQHGIMSPDMRAAVTHLLCASKLSNATLVAEEIGPGTSLYREAMLGYQDFLERKRSSAAVARRGAATPTAAPASPREADQASASPAAVTPRTPRTPTASPRPPPAAEPPAVEVWANLMTKRGKVAKYLTPQK